MLKGILRNSAANLALFFLMISGGAVSVLAAQNQDSSATQSNNAPPRQARPRRARPLLGTIVSVGVDQFQIKLRNGESRAITVDDQTRFRDGQQQIGLEDLKAGDTVMVALQAQNQTSGAALMVRKVSAQQMARFENGNRAFGRITRINGNELELENPFAGKVTVVVNDKTQYTKDGQAIALKDLKVGDGLMAVGEQQNGRLVAQHIYTGNPRPGGPGGGRGQGAGPGGPPPQQ